MTNRATIVWCFATVAAGCGGGGVAKPDAPATVADASPDAAPSLTELCGPLDPGSAWQRCSANPLVTGMRPSSDGRTELTEADPTVMFDDDEQLWKAWWSVVITSDCTMIGTPTDDHEVDIKYAESRDGIHWSIQAEPVMRSHGATTAWDYTTVETPTVVKDNSAPADQRYAMIYSGGNNADLMILGQTGWQLGLAYSPDGKTFTRLPAADSPYASAATPFQDVTGLVLLASDAFPALTNLGPGIVADPELHKRGDTWHLWFSSLAMSRDGQTALAYGVSHATSTDLVHWTMTPTNPVIVGAATPAVYDDGTSYELWFHNDSNADKATIPSVLYPTLGVWHVTSTDGVTWTAPGATRDFMWDSQLTYETYGQLPGVAIARDPSGPLRMYYSAWGSVPAPDGSCVYTQTGTVPGTDNLLLAVRVE